MNRVRTFSFPGNEEKPNRTAALVCAVLSVFLLAYIVMIRMNVIEDTNHPWTYASTLICSVIMTAAVILYAVSDGKSWWVRYVLMSSIMITALIFCVIMTGSYLVFVLPMILCILYYNKEFSILMSVVCGALMLLEPVLSYYADKVNLNYVDLIGEGNGTVMISGWGWDSIEFQLVNYTVPSMVIFISISMLAIWLTHSGFENIMKFNETALREAAIDKELAIASDIQRGMLPGEIPGKGDFSISAKMLTARSVGGDFYDFLKADDTHVALVIADVSGKGTPAALFMASAKSAIRSNLANGLQPDMVMKKTNQILCDSNREKLFVTSWLGIIDLETGRMSYVNAGHNPPFLIRGGKAEKLIDPPNFILGRKKRAEYKEHRITLQPGDVLFLYTDGVTEAVGADKKMFGESRLQDLLSGAGEDAGGIIETVDSEIRKFVGDVERSDDITMVTFALHRYMREELEFRDFVLDRSSYAAIMSHIRGALESSKCPENVIRDNEVCSSEILANIDMYAYQEKGGELVVAVSHSDRKAKVVFRDRGPEYNPLLKDNPDVEMRIKDHKVGGFGLFIVRKMMDEVTYSRENGYNVLTIKRGY